MFKAFYRKCSNCDSAGSSLLVLFCGLQVGAKANVLAAAHKRTGSTETNDTSQRGVHVCVSGVLDRTIKGINTRQTSASYFQATWDQRQNRTEVLMANMFPTLMVSETRTQPHRFYVFVISRGVCGCCMSLQQLHGVRCLLLERSSKCIFDM